MKPDYDAHIASESTRFRTALAASDPTAPVPSCPDWTASDLLWHLAEVQNFWGTIVRDQLSTPESGEPPERPDQFTDLLNCFDDACELLTSSLDATSDDVAVWTWAETAQHVGFIRRRQAHEALIHRLDAELTIDSRTPMDSVLAADGVAEALEHVFGGIPSWARVTGLDRCGRLRAVDTDDVWAIQMGRWSGTSPDTGNRYDDELMLQIVADGEIEFEITGGAADLDAWMWSRPTTAPLTRTGDTAAIDELISTGVP